MAPAYPTSAIVLCAGASTRMGWPKAAGRLQGEPLVLHHLRALARRCDPVIVVLGAHSDVVAPLLPPAVLAVTNPEWATTGPIESIAVGLRAVPEGSACVVTPVDTPPVTAPVLDALLAAGGTAVPTTPDGRDGHPVLLAPALVQRVLADPPSGGLREVLGPAIRVRTDEPDVAADFDTPAEWDAFRRRWTGV